MTRARLKEVLAALAEDGLAVRNGKTWALTPKGLALQAFQAQAAELRKRQQRRAMRLV